MPNHLQMLGFQQVRLWLQLRQDFVQVIVICGSFQISVDQIYLFNMADANSEVWLQLTVWIKWPNKW